MFLCDFLFLHVSTKHMLMLALLLWLILIYLYISIVVYLNKFLQYVALEIQVSAYICSSTKHHTANENIFQFKSQVEFSSSSL